MAKNKQVSERDLLIQELSSRLSKERLDEWYEVLISKLQNTTSLAELQYCNKNQHFLEELGFSIALVSLGSSNIDFEVKPSIESKRYHALVDNLKKRFREQFSKTALNSSSLKEIRTLSSIIDLISQTRVECTKNKDDQVLKKLEDLYYTKLESIIAECSDKNVDPSIMLDNIANFVNQFRHTMSSFALYRHNIQDNDGEFKAQSAKIIDDVLNDNTLDILQLFMKIQSVSQDEMIKFFTKEISELKTSYQEGQRELGIVQKEQRRLNTELAEAQEEIAKAKATATEREDLIATNTQEARVKDLDTITEEAHFEYLEMLKRYHISPALPASQAIESIYSRVLANIDPLTNPNDIRQGLDLLNKQVQEVIISTTNRNNNIQKKIKYGIYGALGIVGIAMIPITIMAASFLAIPLSIGGCALLAGLANEILPKTDFFRKKSNTTLDNRLNQVLKDVLEQNTALQHCVGHVDLAGKLNASPSQNTNDRENTPSTAQSVAQDIDRSLEGRGSGRS